MFLNNDRIYPFPFYFYFESPKCIILTVRVLRLNNGETKEEREEPGVIHLYPGSGTSPTDGVATGPGDKSILIGAMTESGLHLI